MKLLKFCWVLIALWSCGLQSMDTHDKNPDTSSTIIAAQATSIESLPEDVLLKIWMLGFKQTVGYFDNLYSIMKPIRVVLYVCKSWNKLWDQRQASLVDAAKDIHDPIYYKRLVRSTPNCLIS